ncbi:MAG TPA: ATP-binding protein [Ktedonobacterales bacterium]
MMATVIPHAWRERWRGLWLAVPWWRALAEVLIAQAPVLLWALLFQLDASNAMVRAVIVLIVPVGPGCILWCVFRMRRPPWPWPARLLLYTAMGALVGLTPTLLLANVWQANPQRPPHFPTTWFAAVWLIAFTGAFVISRLGVRLLVIWNGLRRRHLVFALTHAHLLVVVLGMCLVVALLATIEVLTNPNHGVPLQLLPVLFFFFLLTVVVLLIVLPPSALFSYLFANRTTRRLQALAHATSDLRGGDYGIRVPVEGEDEVAQLQTNFNAMAADLERGVRELQAERDTVTALLAARRELVASVSHELRTPVATLRGYLESAREHWNGTPPVTLRGDLEIMARETVRLQALIDDLFTLARAEVSRLELRLAAVDAAEVARRCVASVAPLAWQRGRVEVTAEIMPGTPLARADAARLEQVIQNLLHNAVRHTPPGGIVAVTVAPEGDAAGETAVVLRVQDTGEGIPAAELPRIWERFYRTARSRDGADGGTGLGLALVKELTEAMGGSVAVESMPGAGSCFTLRLPADLTPRPPLPRGEGVAEGELAGSSARNGVAPRD